MREWRIIVKHPLQKIQLTMCGRYTLDKDKPVPDKEFEKQLNKAIGNKKDKRRYKIVY